MLRLCDTIHKRTEIKCKDKWYRESFVKERRTKWLKMWTFKGQATQSCKKCDQILDSKVAQFPPIVAKK